MTFSAQSAIYYDEFKQVPVRTGGVLGSVNLLLEMEGKTVSSLPDFAEVFVFLQNLGPHMKLPKISLADLENFFRRGE